MRIISGSYRGKVIMPPKGFDSRPTTDVAKESLFNILLHNFDFESCSVLDAFSGTGNITYEFASRGCPDITSVEINPRSYQYIKKVCAELHFAANIIKGNAFLFLQKTHKKFDIIFADPPFDLKSIDTIPDIVFAQQLLNEDGWLIIEHGNNHNFASHSNFKEVRKYGKVHFSIFE